MEIGKRFASRIGLTLFAILGLAGVYLFQRIDVLSILVTDGVDPAWHFVANRAVRIFLNDCFMVMLIYALFLDKEILKLAIAIQLIDLCILFPFYLLLKLPTEGPSEISSPFLSQLHRLIVHPTLMILLIPAVYYQRIKN